MPSEQARLPNSSIQTRADLRNRILMAFGSQPEVNAIYAFGREVDGQPDCYSDVDLIVYSNDLAASQHKCADVLASVSPVLGTYCIVLEPRTLAQMVIFRDYSPYQKLDFSITDDVSAKQSFAPLACLYQREAEHQPSKTCIEQTGQRQALGNWLNDVLFSIPRFTKCLFRRDRDMYRRWVGAVEHLAVMLHERYFGWSREHRYRLQAHEYKALNKHLSPEDQDLLDRIQPLDRCPDLPLGYELAVGAIVRLYQAKSLALGEPLDMGFADYMQRFLRNEIGRYRTTLHAL